MAFKPLLQEIQLKPWLLERVSEALTSKLWNKNIHAVEAYRNGAKLNYVHPYDFIKNLWQIYLKNKVGNTTWAKLCGLIGQKQQNSFQEIHTENSFVSIRQAGEQVASTWPLAFLSQIL